MELIPCVQTLAHLNAIFRWKDYAAINDTNDILLAEDDRTYKLIDNIFKTLHETFTSRNVNIGMDEAHMLGRGAYYDRHGDVPRPEIMQKHLVKVLEIAAKYGFTCEMWSDMFLRMAYGDYYVQTKDESDSVAETVPENVRLIYWDYYSTDKEHYANLIDRHRKLTNDVQFAGGAWTWTGFCPPTNSASKRPSRRLPRAAKRI